MNLTHENYHTLESRYLTGSRIKDFLKCKQYFYQLHISGERKSKKTEALIIGSAVDVWLTRGENAFKREYLSVARRNVKNPPVGYTELTNSQFDEVVSLCTVLERQPAFEELKNHIAQAIIKYDESMGEHFCGLSFMPDWYKIEGDVCIITDLKTTANGSEKKYFWHCVDYKYFEQMAVATLIFRKTNPEIKEFVYRHLVVEKDVGGVPMPYTYFLDNNRVEVCANIIKNEVIPMIASEKEFMPKEVSWSGSPTIGSLDNEWDE